MREVASDPIGRVFIGLECVAFAVASYAAFLAVAQMGNGMILRLLHGYAAYYGLVIVMNALIFTGASDNLLGGFSLCMFPMVVYLMLATAYHLYILYLSCSMFRVYYVLMGLLTFHFIDIFIITPALLSKINASKDA